MFREWNDCHVIAFEMGMKKQRICLNNECSKVRISRIARRFLLLITKRDKTRLYRGQADNSVFRHDLSTWNVLHARNFADGKWEAVKCPNNSSQSNRPIKRVSKQLPHSGGGELHRQSIWEIWTANPCRELLWQPSPYWFICSNNAHIKYSDLQRNKLSKY